MSSLTLCSKLSDQSVRIRIEGINFSGTVGDLKAKCAKKIDKSSDEFDLFYAGVLLKEETALNGHGVKSGVTVYAMKSMKHVSPESDPEPMDEAAAQQVVTALQTALLNPAYRNIVEKMVTDDDTMENLVVAIPELDQDPVAMAILQDAELLAMLADPKLIRKVIEVHPCLGQAALYIAAAVTEEGVKVGSSSEASSASYSLDRMSDEDDDDAPSQSRHLPRSGQSEITANQLAAALAAASDSSQPSTSSSQSNNGVSLDFFQQAMAQAQSTQPESSSQETRSSSQPASIEAQLQQMRDMGITDESVARTALNAAGGNVQAALEIIFGDGSEGM